LYKADGIVAWVVKVRHRWFYCNDTFYNEAEAFAHLQKVNVKEGLDIKNKFTVFQDKVVVLLPNGHFTCDADDINIVENHLWSANGLMQQNNTLGTVGVHYNCHHRSWNATWKDGQGDKHAKLYSTMKYGPACAKDLAIQYRAYIERNLPHYAIMLGINADGQE